MQKNSNDKISIKIVNLILAIIIFAIISKINSPSIIMYNIYDITYIFKVSMIMLKYLILIMNLAFFFPFKKEKASNQTLIGMIIILFMTISLYIVSIKDLFNIYTSIGLCIGYHIGLKLSIF